MQLPLSHVNFPFYLQVTRPPGYQTRRRTREAPGAQSHVHVPFCLQMENEGCNCFEPLFQILLIIIRSICRSPQPGGGLIDSQYNLSSPLLPPQRQAPLGRGGAVSVAGLGKVSSYHHALIRYVPPDGGAHREDHSTPAVSLVG